jgi:hypothetical protein
MLSEKGKTLLVHKNYYYFILIKIICGLYLHVILLIFIIYYMETKKNFNHSNYI